MPHQLLQLVDARRFGEILRRPAQAVPRVRRQRMILLGGFSKNYAMTGWRAGFACGPADIIKGLVRVHQYTIMSAPTTAQDAAIEVKLAGARPAPGGGERKSRMSPFQARCGERKRPSSAGRAPTVYASRWS